EAAGAPGGDLDGGAGAVGHEGDVVLDGAVGGDDAELVLEDRDGDLAGSELEHGHHLPVLARRSEALAEDDLALPVAGDVADVAADDVAALVAEVVLAPLAEVRAQDDEPAVVDEDPLLHAVAGDVGDEVEPGGAAQALLLEEPVVEGLLGLGVE